MHVHVVAVALEELSYRGSLIVRLEVLSRFAYSSLEVLSRCGGVTV